MDIQPLVFVGIDIAAKTFTATWLHQGQSLAKPITFAQTPDGWQSLQQRLLATGVAPEQILVVMEATGSYWITGATTLVAAHFRVSVINPAQAHYFAKALLKRSKTDAIDAATLAQLLQPASWTPPPAVYHEVQQRLHQREALLAMRQQVRNQRHALLQHPIVVTAVHDRMDVLITTLTEQIAAVEAEIATALDQDAAWAAAAKRLQTIPGIGLLTAATLLTTTLKFTVCDTAEATASYAGLVPREWSSGTSIARTARIGHTGNTQLRTSLYLATLSACRHNPIIKPFYDRLRAKGKRNKVARCAAARKLLPGIQASGTATAALR